MILEFFEHPLVLLLIIPVLIVVYFILKKNFVDYRRIDGVEFKERAMHRKKIRSLVFISRLIIFSLLLIAIASPFITKDVMVEGDPAILILVDNSTSFDLFDKTVGQRLNDQLKGYMPTEISSLAQGEVTALGDGILSSLGTGKNLLLITDGQNNYGTTLESVAAYASRANTSINAIELEPINKDFGVSIVGPSKAVAGVNNYFKAIINRAGTSSPVKLHIRLNNEIILNTETIEPEVEFDARLPEGYHRIIAELEVDDYFQSNNIYYKTINVVQKPSLLFVTQTDSQLPSLLNDYYDIITRGSVPDDLSEYYAVVLNDMDATYLNPKTDSLVDFVADGNGLVVIGGASSYNMGSYKDSEFSSLLPVTIASGDSKKSNVNLVIVLDISGSTGAIFGLTSTVEDVEKALAVNILNEIGSNNKIGVVAFNTKGYVVSELQAHLDKTETTDKIKRLVYKGGTYIDTGIYPAIELLKDEEGGKNIILISDGKISGTDLDKNMAYESVMEAQSQGIDIYSVGVGLDTNEEVMKKIAELGQGIYYSVNEYKKLGILFGESDETEGKQGKGDLVIIDSNHFITQDLEINANLNELNYVAPKSSARMLVTTDRGEPIFVVWRFGLGRVVSIATSEASLSRGGMLTADNSRLISRAINWAIGSPDRKSEYLIDINDGVLGEELEAVVKSEKVPVAEGITFTKLQDNLYSAKFIPTTTGFLEFLGRDVAVNYKNEYLNLGFNNQEIRKIAAITNGLVLKESQIQDIVNAVHSQSKRMVSKPTLFRWVFILPALCLFLLEICLRRIYQYKK